MADSSIGLPATDNIHTATWPQCLIKMLRQVDAMDPQKIKTAAVEPFKAQPQLSLENIRILSGRNLALQDASGVFTARQSPAQLTFGAAVVAGGFHMMKTLINGQLKCFLEIDL